MQPKQDEKECEPMNVKQNKRMLIAGGICGILWPILSELLFYALYPILASSAKIPPASSFDTYLRGAAELGRNPAILTLEWGKVYVPLLLLPFLLALYRFMSQRGQQNVVLIAVGLGLFSIAFTIFGHTFNSTINHTLGKVYVDAGSETERAALLSMARVFSVWHGGINQIASFLYQGSLGLLSLALLRNRTWRFWGWLGLIGALLAIPAKIPFGWQVPTNFIWTGIAYFFLPVGLGVGLIEAGRCSNPAKRMP